MASYFSQPFLKYFLQYFLPAFLFISLLGIVGINQAQDKRIAQFQQDAHEKVASATAASVLNLDLVVRDIHYIAHGELLNKVLSAPKNTSQIEFNASMDALARDWQGLIHASSVFYDQLRWIDETGQERLRVNSAKPFPIRSADDDLQDKSHRYYFLRTMLLNEEQFYFSPFDLNIEHGQIEEPRKPMIRVAKPVVDEQGVRRGVIVLNYLGSRMLSRIKTFEQTSYDNLWLTNADGYWLLASKPQDEWGFMFAQPDLTLKDRYPDAWQTIVNEESGEFWDKNNGLWHFSTIRPMQLSADLKLAQMQDIAVDALVLDGKVLKNEQGLNQYFWKIVYFAPEADVKSGLWAARVPFYWALLVGFVIIGLTSAYLARAKIDKEQALIDLKASNAFLDQTSKQLVADVTAKELAQHELEQSVQRYSAVLNASMDGFVLMNRFGVILESNDSLFNILHLEPKEIEGTFLGSLFEGENRQMVADRIGDLFVQGYCRFEVECTREDERCFTEISLMPIMLTEQVCAFMRDITHQRETDFQLEMAASVFTHANEGIMLTDDKFTIVNVNDEYEFITGYKRDDVIGLPSSLLESEKQPKSFYDEMKRRLFAKDHWYGELWSRRKTGELYLVFLSVTRVRHPHTHSSHFVWMFSDITLEKQYQKKLQDSAHYDQLTNLPNRFLLNDRVQQAMLEASRNEQFMAIVFIDLDGFKAVNDTFGHEMGDQVLLKAAKQMTAALRATDTVARIGGDEFVAVIGALQNEGEAQPVVEKLLKALYIPVTKENQTLHVSGSLGVTFYPQETEHDAEQLIRQADQAMYQAKKAGKNKFHIFDSKKDSDKLVVVRNLDDIQQALSNNEFVLHYQPQVSLVTDKVIGLEALVRWQHPEKGLLYPGDFLMGVENTQLAVKLTEWVVRQAMQQMVAWQKKGLNVLVSVNIGGFELYKTNFVEWVSSLLDEYPSIPRSLFEFEIKEITALEDLHTIQELIQKCNNRGMSFVLDNFGTGFASLSSLKRLPIETIKIDQSFIKNMFNDPEDITLLEGLIGLTKSLNRTVVAKGIETEEQAKVMVSLGCHYAQGHLIAKPLFPENVPEFMREWKRPDAWGEQTEAIEQD